MDSDHDLGVMSTSERLSDRGGVSRGSSVIIPEDTNFRGLSYTHTAGVGYSGQ